MNLTPRQCRVFLCNLGIGILIVSAWSRWGFDVFFLAATIYFLTSIRDCIVDAS